MKSFHFSPLKPRLVKHVARFDTHESDEKPSAYRRVVWGHPLNSQAELFVPSKLHFHLKPLLPRPRQALWDPSFIQQYILPGRFLALSSRTSVDHCNVLACVPPGILHLVLDRDTHQRLGLAGTKSKFKANKEERFNVQIDLTGAAMLPGHKLHARLLWCLRERVGPADLMLACTDQHGQDVHIQLPTLHPTPIPAPVLESVPILPSHTSFPSLLIPALNPPALGLPSPKVSCPAAAAFPAFPFPATLCLSKDADSSNEQANTHTPPHQEPDNRLGDQERPDEGRACKSRRLEVPQQAPVRPVGPATAQTRNIPAQDQDEHCTRQAGDGAEGDEGQGSNEAEACACALNWLGLLACRIICALKPPVAPAEWELDPLATGRRRLRAGVDQGWPVQGRLGQGQSLRYTGLLGPRVPDMLLAVARRLVADEKRGVPWAALMVWGHPESPQSWNQQEHDITTSDGGFGENDYVVIVFPESYCLFMGLGCYDTTN
eukprot:g17540.t1